MKYALVTGGSRGIGRAICQRMAQEGYQVIINYTSNDAEAQKTAIANRPVRHWSNGNNSTMENTSR